MGCQVSYCQEEYKINTKETIKASNQFYNTNRKTQRTIEKCKKSYSEITIDRNISEDEESTKKITGESYKRVLIDLIDRQRIENQQKSRGDFSTYMIPFKQLVENTNPQKFERLYLNLIAATSEAKDILMKLDQEPDQKEMQKELQTFVEDMVKQDRNQYQLKIKKTLSTSSVYEIPSIQKSPSVHYFANMTNNNNENMKQSGLNNNVESDVWEVNRNDSFFGNKGQSMSFKGNASFQLPTELIENSMSNPFQDFSCPQVKIQKFLFNYLYEKVGKNQHIVRDLIDKFSELICDKFNITQESEPLSGFDLESMPQIEQQIRQDILFFVDLLKKYLNEIYGKQLLEPKFNQSQKDAIFDIFVRKVIFDNTQICAIARTAISLSLQKSLIQLKSLFLKLKKLVSVKNAFHGKLKFISKDDKLNPFESLDEIFEDICCTSSPFLKQVQFKELRDKMVKILDAIQLKLKSKKRKFQAVSLEADDFTAIYNFVILFAKAEIYLEVQFIELYGTRTSSCPVFAFLTGIYDEFIRCSQDPEHGVSEALELFKENLGEDGKIEEEKTISNIDEMEEDDTSSKMSILENHNRTLLFQRHQTQQVYPQMNNLNNNGKSNAKQDKLSFTLSSSAVTGGLQKNQPRTQSEGSLKITFNYNNLIQDAMKTTVEQDSQLPNNQNRSSANCLTLNDATKIYPENISASSKIQDLQATLRMNRSHQTLEEQQQFLVSNPSNNNQEQVKNTEQTIDNIENNNLLENKQQLKQQ